MGTDDDFEGLNPVTLGQVDPIQKDAGKAAGIVRGGHRTKAERSGSLSPTCRPGS